MPTPSSLPTPYNINIENENRLATLPDEPWTLYLDESYDDQLLTVGGFAAPTQELSGLVDSWRELKLAMGCDPVDELKHNAGRRRDVAAKLDAAGWPHRHRVPAMVEHIARTGVVIIANTAVDARGDQKPLKWYPDTFDWVVRQYAFCFPGTGPGLSLRHVVVDLPPGMPTVDDACSTPHLDETLADPGKAVFKRYAERWAAPRKTQRGNKLGRWRDKGLAPELHSAHAACCDQLQMADVVAGTVREFVKWNLYGPGRPWDLPEWEYQDRNFDLLAPQILGLASDTGCGVYAVGTHPRAAKLRAFIDDQCREATRERRHATTRVTP